MTENDKLLNQAMLLLAALPRAIFVGQNVAYAGTVMYHHLEGVPPEQRLEMPVAEEFQLGLCAGLSLQGFTPISIYPRMDFLMRAMDQLVNHLDKLQLMSRGQYKPKVIIRTRVGPHKPLDAGPQHTQDHTRALRQMLTNVGVLRVDRPRDILPAYREAAAAPRSTLVVEAL